MKFIVGVTELVTRSPLLEPVSDAVASVIELMSSGIVYEIRTAPVTPGAPVLAACA